MKNKYHLIVGLMAGFVLYSGHAIAQKKKKNEPAAVKADSVSKSNKAITLITSKCKAYKGLFDLYQNEKDGSVYLLIKKDQLNKEFIYFSHTTDGVVDGSHFRGAFRDNKIFKIKRYFERIEFVTQNTSFYFDPSNALSKAANANISEAVMVSEKIEAEDKEKGDILIKAEKIFLSEDLDPIKPNLPPTYQGFKLGNLNKDKTRYEAIRNYPKNTDLIIQYVFDNPAPQGATGAEVTDPRFVTIKSQHSLIEIPQNDFISTFDDPRVGYFATEINDMTKASDINYRDVIHKWNLKKKDPNAALSEPIEPIVYWIENTTPLEYREIIAKAGLAWNEAFEKAGFKNAIQMKVQPDTATWDAGDIRYNVLRWTSSPQPPFGGYGPSFVNPRTGQILGADIMLEFVYLTNRIRQQNIYESAASEELLLSPSSLRKNLQYCNLGDNLHQTTMAGMTALQMMNATEAEIKEVLETSVYYLVLHEMGHTLGLMHNMKSSQLYSPDQINNKELTLKTGLIGSVMDYPAINLASEKAKQGQYFTTKPGPYDNWAIEFAYGTLPDAQAEKTRQSKILARSTEPALTFGNDADDMRSPGKAIDPRVMINDLSSDAIKYSSDRIKLMNKLIVQLKDSYLSTNKDKSYQDFRTRYLVMFGEQFNAARAISRYIGGVYVDRSFIGQSGAAKPYTPVSYVDQKRALLSLNQLIFSSKSLSAPSEIYNYLQIQRRGFNFFTNTEDPKIIDRALAMHQDILSHILSPVTLKRIVDSEFYGNKYKITEMLNDLTGGIFNEDIAGSVNPIRQNLQSDYVNKLIAMLSPERTNMYAYPVQAAALYQINHIKRMIAANPGIDEQTKAHRSFIAFKIQKALEK